MARIAFDVKGTIEGYHHDKVLALYKALQVMGHEMYVWSSLWSYAYEANEKYNLGAIVESKWCKSYDDMVGTGGMDLAIDDDFNQSHLATKAFVFVNDLPDDILAFALEVNNYLTTTKTCTDFIPHQSIKLNT